MFKVLVPGCEPSRGSKYSACVDLYASEDVVISAGETKLVGLGICIDDKFLNNSLDSFAEFSDISDDGLYKGESLELRKHYFLSSHYLQLMLRSSLSKELIIANGVGVIDLDYEDEIKIKLHNPIKVDFIAYWLDKFRLISGLYNSGTVNIKKGDRIAQITLVEHKSYLFGISTETERTGGFGSTDEKN